MNYRKFHTVVDVPKYNWLTGYNKKNMFLGSCFTENIGNRMATLKFDTDINPFGILYNPVSVANGLRILLRQKMFDKSDLIEHDGLWHSFSHHGRFSFSSREEALQQINDRIIFSSEYLKKTGFLYITFGTAWIYLWKKTGQPVSNCHKIPAGEFIRKRLSVSEIVTDFISLLNEIREQNRELKVVFTVSPIRHLKDGAIENQRSKAALLLAIDEIIAHFGTDFCSYFPAYEIVMDELRDYRFYAEDMIHISDFAINYIWEKFTESLIDKQSSQLAKEVEKIVKAKEHKYTGRNLLEYNRFLKTMLERSENLEKQFSNLNLDEEKRYFSIKLTETELR